MQLEFFDHTDEGDRPSNQDYMAHILADKYALCIVADGLGGHSAGEKASRYFCEGMMKLADAYCEIIQWNPVSVLTKWIDEAITEMRVLFGDDMAVDYAYTTCAILYLTEKFTLTAHCGDSRVYRLNTKEVLWRTADHSLIQEKVNKGLIKEDEIGSHPDQNQLTRSVNVNKWHEVEIKQHSPIQPGEAFVLCSDGFWAHIKQDEFLELAEPINGAEHLDKLVRIAINRADGKSDNVTVQTIRHLDFGPYFF